MWNLAKGLFVSDGLTEGGDCQSLDVTDCGETTTSL